MLWENGSWHGRVVIFTRCSAMALSDLGVPQNKMGREGSAVRAETPNKLPLNLLTEQAMSVKTGKPFASEFAHVLTVAGGKATSFKEFTDTAAMLNAATA